jgi:transposase
MDEFYRFLEEKKAKKIHLPVMDMWKAFVTSTRRHTPQAAIPFDKFAALRHLGEALDTVRQREYGRLQGKLRTSIKGQRYTLLAQPQKSHRHVDALLAPLLLASGLIQLCFRIADGRTQYEGHRGVLLHECRLKYCTARSCFSAASRVSNVPRFRRRFVRGSILRE